MDRTPIVMFRFVLEMVFQVADRLATPKKGDGIDFGSHRTDILLYKSLAKVKNLRKVAFHNMTPCLSARISRVRPTSAFFCVSVQPRASPRTFDISSTSGRVSWPK